MEEIFGIQLGSVVRRRSDNQNQQITGTVFSLISREKSENSLAEQYGEEAVKEMVQSFEHMQL